MMAKCKIVIEIDGQSTEYFFENVDIVQERGTEKIINANGCVDSMQSNGQNRLTIKAWSGIDKFENFVKLVEIYK